MADDEKWLNEAKLRLAEKHGCRRRPGSIAAKVEALLPEIRAARATGKSWAQVAADIADDEPLNADAVRVAARRCCDGVSPEPSASQVQASDPKPVTTSNKSSNSADSIPNLFDPMFDARDSWGRSNGHTSGKESQS